MSDTGRQSLTDKAGAALKPDSQKTTTEHLGDQAKGLVDGAASYLQPQGEKSTGQKVGDAASSSGTNESFLDQAKNALANITGGTNGPATTNSGSGVNNGAKTGGSNTAPKY